MRKCAMLNKDYTKEWKQDGIIFFARIDPCSWMYKDYGLQISIANTKDKGWIKRNLDKPFEKCIVEDFEKLCTYVHLIKCKKCEKMAFDPKYSSTNRKGLCENCFLGQLERDYKEIVKKGQRETRKRDEKLKKDGYTHRITAWIHPKEGGDDRCVDIYFSRKPTKTMIYKELKNKGSRILNDYSIFTL